MVATSDTTEKATLTVRELAKILGIGTNLAYELVKKEEIKSIRVGRKILIPKIAVSNWLEGNA